MVKNGERSVGELDRRFLYSDSEVYDMDVTDRNVERGDDEHRDLDAGQVY